MSLLRDVLKKTDAFMETAGHECYDCGGIDYRDALRGIVRVLGLPRRQRWYVVHAYDRVERYRKYLRELAYVAEYGPRKPSTLSVRTMFEAQSKILDAIYQRRFAAGPA